jgi:choline dehydrogenase
MVEAVKWQLAILNNCSHGIHLSDLAAAWDTLSVSSSEDANGGKVEGFTIRPMMVDRDSSLRSSAATAFYYPVADRPNLRLVRGTALNLIREDRGTNDKQRASGVVYLDGDGTSRKIMLQQSGGVILAAGALATPGILEAFGVGNPSILNKLGVEVRIELPGVGENFQDQPDLTFSWNPRTSAPGVFTPYAAFVTAKDIFQDDFEEVAK